MMSFSGGLWGGMVRCAKTLSNSTYVAIKLMYFFSWIWRLLHLLLRNLDSPLLRDLTVALPVLLLRGLDASLPEVLVMVLLVLQLRNLDVSLPSDVFAPPSAQEPWYTSPREA